MILTEAYSKIGTASAFQASCMDSISSPFLPSPLPPTPRHNLLPPPRPRKQNFSSLLAPRPLSVWVRVAPLRGLLPTSPLAVPTIPGPRKMSTTLLSAFYDIDFLCKVSRRRERLADGLEPSEVPRLAAGPGCGGRDPSKLTLRVEGSPGVSSAVRLRLWAWRVGRERVAAGGAVLLPNRTRPRCRDFPDCVCAAHPVATGPGSHG